MTTRTRAAVKHKGLVGSEEIMTDKQRKEENGTVPKSKG